MQNETRKPLKSMLVLKPWLLGNGNAWFSVRRLPIADQGGESRFLLGIIEDQTDQFRVAA